MVHRDVESGSQRTRQAVRPGIGLWKVKLSSTADRAITRFHMVLPPLLG